MISGAASEDLEVVLYLGVHAAAVDDSPGAFVDLPLLDGEGVADDVLGEALQVVALVGQNTAACDTR